MIGAVADGGFREKLIQSVIRVASRFFERFQHKAQLSASSAVADTISIEFEAISDLQTGGSPREWQSGH